MLRPTAIAFHLQRTYEGPAVINKTMAVLAKRCTSFEFGSRT